jgi:hypothetical protein
MQPGGDILLHISICCKLFARQVHDITGPAPQCQLVLWLEVMDHTPYNPDLAHSQQVVCGRHQH